MTVTSDHDFDAFAAAAEDIIRAGQPEGANLKNLQTRFDYFHRWCLARSESSLPASEQTVLRFLWDHHPRWSHGNARSYVHAITWSHRAIGVVAPCGNGVRDYLRNVLIEAGRLVEQPVDALRTSDAARIAERFERSVLSFRCEDDTEPMRVRAALVIMRVTGLPLVSQRSSAGRAPMLSRDAFTVTATEVRIRVPEDGKGRVVLVGAGQLPVEYGILRDCLAAAGSRSTPLVPVEAEGGRQRLVVAVRDAYRRAGLTPDCDLKALGDRHWWWLLASADRDLARRVRNIAYLLTGTFTARRHAELCAADIEHLRRTDSGFALLVPRSKGKQGPRVYPVHHEEPGGMCSAVCPACAVERWLEHQELCEDRRTGILFPTRYGNALRRMTRQNGRLIVRALWLDADGDPDAKIGTRSMRVGAATSAAEAAFTIQEVAREVTDHADLDTCELYIRRDDGDAGTFQLAL